MKILRCSIVLLCMICSRSDAQVIAISDDVAEVEAIATQVFQKNYERLLQDILARLPTEIQSHVSDIEFVVISGNRRSPVSLVRQRTVAVPAKYLALMFYRSRDLAIIDEVLKNFSQFPISGKQNVFPCFLEILTFYNPLDGPKQAEICTDVALKDLSAMHRALADADPNTYASNTDFFFFELVGFMMAHEIGHFALEHRPSRELSAEVSIKQEYAADIFAFEHSDFLDLDITALPILMLTLGDLGPFANAIDGAQKMFSGDATTHPSAECRAKNLLRISTSTDQSVLSEIVSFFREFGSMGSMSIFSEEVIAESVLSFIDVFSKVECESN